MTKENYLQHLNERIASINHKIADARDFLENGKLAEKVIAAGELQLLEADHEKYAHKLEKAKESHAEDWSALNTTLHEDLDALSDAIESWIVKHQTIRQ